MELRHLRYFVAVAEELNFTRAADRLAISQPPLSAQIRQLEDELGSELLNRAGRAVTLTSAGKLLLEEARTILKQIDNTKSAVSRRGRTAAGRLILGSAGGTYFHPLIPQIIREYRKQFPDIALIPQAGGTALLTARLRTGNIDIALLRPPVADASGLALEQIAIERLAVVLPKGHRLAARESIPLVALAKEIFVMFPRALNPSTHDMVISACRAAGFVPTIGQEAPQVLSIMPLVAAGLGVSIVPSSISRILRDEICAIPLEGDVPAAEIHLAYRRKDASRAAKDFVRIAREILRAEGAPR
jgi:DNA-binding transcriptional LysR family regulator